MVARSQVPVRLPNSSARMTPAPSSCMRYLRKASADPAVHFGPIAQSSVAEFGPCALAIVGGTFDRK